MRKGIVARKWKEKILRLKWDTTSGRQSRRTHEGIRKGMLTQTRFGSK